MIMLTLHVDVEKLSPTCSAKGINSCRRRAEAKRCTNSLRVSASASSYVCAHPARAIFSAFYWLACAAAAPVRCRLGYGNGRVSGYESRGDGKYLMISEITLYVHEGGEKTTLVGGRINDVKFSKHTGEPIKLATDTWGA